MCTISEIPHDITHCYRNHQGKVLKVLNTTVTTVYYKNPSVAILVLGCGTREPRIIMIVLEILSQLCSNR
jgi:hypothetical protein